MLLDDISLAHPIHAGHRTLAHPASSAPDVLC